MSELLPPMGLLFIALSTTNSTGTEPGANPGPRGKRPVVALVV
jgi:hypothetical protein